MRVRKVRITLRRNAGQRPEAAGGPDRIAGLRRVALFETIGYLAIALAADQLLGSGDRFGGVTPHPFWPIVLLVAAQYGTGEGLFAALASAVAFRAGNLPAEGFGFDSYAYLWSVAATPVQWLTAAGVLGELRRRHLRRESRLAAELEQTAAREREITAAFEQQRKVKAKLEETVAANMRSAVSLYSAAQHVEQLDPLEVLSGAEALVSAGLSPEKFSLYLLDGPRLLGVIRHGHPENSEDGWVIESSTALYQNVVGKGKILCVARQSDRTALGREAVLAGPLVEQETGETLGMLKIEEMGFLALNLAALQNFEVICRWIASALVKAQKHQDSHAGAAFNVNTQILSHAFYEQQSVFLQRVARRMRFDLTALTVKVDNASELPISHCMEVGAVLGACIGRALRNTDLAFDAERPGGEFTILLVNTSLVQARVVARKLEADLRQRLPGSPATFSFHLRPLHLTPGDPDAPPRAGSIETLGKILSGTERTGQIPVEPGAWRA